MAENRGGASNPNLPNKKNNPLSIPNNKTNFSSNNKSNPTQNKRTIPSYSNELTQNKKSSLTKTKKPIQEKKEEKVIISSSFNPRKIDYPYATKRSFREFMRDVIPPEFIPTEVMGYVFGGLFLLVLLLSLFFVPYGQILQGNITNVNLTAGIPMHFVTLQLENPDRFPVGGKEIIGLLVDSLVFLIIAYIINVIFNYIRKTPAVLSDREKGKYPRLYKVDRPASYAEKITEKVFEKDDKKINKTENKVKNKSGLSEKKTNSVKKTTPQNSPKEKIGKKISNPDDLV